MQQLDIPVIRINERYMTEVWILSDVHYGHKDFDREHFNVYMKWLASGKYHKVLGLGDYFENALPVNGSAKMLWDQVLTPKEQLDGFIEMLEPVKSKILGMATGNHERRLRNDTSFDATELLCKFLNVPFLGYMGWICLDSGSVQYYLHYHHGVGTSASAEGQLKKLENAGYHGADIRVIGHGHCLAWIPRTSMIVNRERGVVERRICHEIRSGGFLSEPEYAQVKMLSISSIGSPIIRLHPKKKVIDVRMGLTTEGTYGFEDVPSEEIEVE